MKISVDASIALPCHCERSRVNGRAWQSRLRNYKIASSPRICGTSRNDNQDMRR
jgi:hypothetical protein